MRRAQQESRREIARPRLHLLEDRSIAGWLSDRPGHGHRSPAVLEARRDGCDLPLPPTARTYPDRANRTGSWRRAYGQRTGDRRTLSAWVSEALRPAFLPGQGPVVATLHSASGTL